MFRKLLIAITTLALSLGFTTTGVAPASAASCGFSSPVELQNLFSSQTYAGVQTTSRIPFVYKYSDAGCLQGMIFTFIGGGGVDVQAVRANVNTNGVSGDASATWVPKAMEYKLLVDVVYQYGSFSDQITTSRWTWPKVLLSGAFVPLPAPSAPTSVNLNGDDRNLTVTWSFPSSNSGSVAKYSVRYPDGRVLCEVTAPTGCSAPNQPDGAYAFIVAAVNTLGVGAEVATNQVRVQPPDKPGFARYSRVNNGKSIALYWTANTGTSALARIYRVFDQNGVEVCGMPVTTSVGSQMTCNVTPAKTGSRYTLKVETNLGNAEGDPTAVLKPQIQKKKKPKKVN